MKSEIAIVAEAVLANIRVLEMLIQKLPDADRAAVAEKVHAVVPAPAAPAAPAPAAPAAPAPVVQAPAAPVAPAAPAGVVPFTSQKELITYVMGAYKALGPNGNKIQDVLNTVGVKNINDVQPAMYKALFDGIEALK